MTRYYLSGPMTGLPQYNYPMFDAAAKQLRAQGLDVVSPHENELPRNIDAITEEALWDRMIAVSIEQLSTCDAIVLLPGWTGSRGAKLELEYMIDKNGRVYFLDCEQWTLIRMDKPVVAPDMRKYSSLDRVRNKTSSAKIARSRLL